MCERAREAIETKILQASKGDREGERERGRKKSILKPKFFRLRTLNNRD